MNNKKRVCIMIEVQKYCKLVLSSILIVFFFRTSFGVNFFFLSFFLLKIQYQKRNFLTCIFCVGVCFFLKKIQCKRFTLF